MSSKNVETLRKCYEVFSAHTFDEAMKLIAPISKVIDHGRGQTFNSGQKFHGWLESLYLCLGILWFGLSGLPTTDLSEAQNKSVEKAKPPRRI